MQPSKYAYDLPNHQLLLDSQDVEAVKNTFGVTDNSITGALVLVDDGSYIDAWFTESETPYGVSAIYHPASYYDRRPMKY